LMKKGGVGGSPDVIGGTSGSLPCDGLEGLWEVRDLRIRHRHNSFRVLPPYQKVSCGRLAWIDAPGEKKKKKKEGKKRKGKKGEG